MVKFFSKTKKYFLVMGMMACCAGATEGVPAPSKLPLQGSVEKDAKGTPRVPQWRMQAGSDEEIGSFYYGFLGKALIPCDRPRHYCQIGKNKLVKWTGAKPFPCVVKLTKLEDGSTGYYFNCITSKEGPRGWFIPHEKEQGKQLKWGIYYLQPGATFSEDSSSPAEPTQPASVPAVPDASNSPDEAAPTSPSAKP